MKEWQMISNNIKEQFNGVWYSPVENKIIILKESIMLLIRKGKPPYKYLEYADEELYGKEMSLKKACRLRYEKIGDL